MLDINVSDDESDECDFLSDSSAIADNKITRTPRHDDKNKSGNLAIAMHTTYVL